MAPPSLDQHLGFLERVEDLAVQQLVAQLAVEALVVAVLPRAAALDEQRPHADPAEPSPHRLGGEFPAVARADVVGRAAFDEEVGQHLQHVVRGQVARDGDGEALARVLVDDRQHAEGPPVVGAVLHEVIGPHMPRPARPQPDARAVVQPQPPALGLPPRHLQPLAPPDAPHPLGIHPPAPGAQHRRDPPVAVAAVLGRQADNRLGQRGLVVPGAARAALRRARLADGAAGPALGNAEHVLHMADTGPAALGA